MPMHAIFTPLVNSLDNIAAAILAVSPGHADGLNVTHSGWNQVGVSLIDLARLASELSLEVRQQATDDLSTDQTADIQRLTATLEFCRANTVPQIWGGNGPVAVPAFMLTIDMVRAKLRPLMPELIAVDAKVLPAQLARKILRLSNELDRVVVDREALSARMNAINGAYEAAGRLPEDLSSLREAHDDVVKLSGDASRSYAHISQQEEDAKAALQGISNLHQEAEKLVAQCEEAYRVTTSKGLAGAFDQRATGLSRSMQLWVVALVVALGAAAYLGGQRVELLSKNLGEADLKWGVIWLNLVS